ncbi:MAG: ROK family protein [Halomonadaceae bacterium]|nr:MAG: ROK family protein [Halomonadaceae bacterium]
MEVLVGDIGGTNARFRLLSKEGDQWCLRHQSTWPSGQFESLEALLDAMTFSLSRLEKTHIEEVWLAVAGPVRAGQVTFTNLPWQADALSLAARFGWSRVTLINDLEALAHAVPGLGETDLMPIQQGSPGNANRLVVSVGTGLGVAILKMQEGRLNVVASEGGHTDFAPANPAQFRLLEYMGSRHGHVSHERILSGHGLPELYRFICEEHGLPSEKAILDAADPTAAINQQAESGQSPMAVATIEQFAQLLGRFVGNAALFAAALGGVYLCGGVAARLHPYFTSDIFLNGFLDRGRMKPTMEQMPVWTIASTEVGLRGITALGTRYGVCGLTVNPCQKDALSQKLSSL